MKRRTLFSTLLGFLVAPFAKPRPTFKPLFKPFFDGHPLFNDGPCYIVRLRGPNLTTEQLEALTDHHMGRANKIFARDFRCLPENSTRYQNSTINSTLNWPLKYETQDSIFNPVGVFGRAVSAMQEGRPIQADGSNCPHQHRSIRRPLSVRPR